MPNKQEKSKKTDPASKPVIKTFGTLYFNGRPQNSGALFNKQPIALGDTVAGKELEWVKIGVGYVAASVVCGSISWDDLNSVNYVFGIPIEIDGLWFLCRCLHTGARKGDPNEWDAILDVAGDDDNIWHWKGASFWGQETTDKSRQKSARGSDGARFWMALAPNRRYTKLGFRPILEPLLPGTTDISKLLGRRVSLIDRNGELITGDLESFDDYDLVLDAAFPLPDESSWATIREGKIILSRPEVWLKEKTIT